jgi:hypothetical protein
MHLIGMNIIYPWTVRRKNYILSETIARASVAVSFQEIPELL